MPTTPYNFYVEHGCEFCNEARALLDSHEISYVLFTVTASSWPGFIDVHREGKKSTVPKSIIPGCPALWDRRQNILACGLESIEKLIAHEKFIDSI
jgi:hypothetical protein